MAYLDSLTAPRLRERLHYNPETGLFTRAVSAGNQVVGSVAGWKDLQTGYVRIGLDGSDYLAHRLAWLYVKGVWPTDQIDHEDTIRHHNWFNNLRPATNALNMQNMGALRSDNKSGYTGVSWNSRAGRWMAVIVVDGKAKELGLFDCPAQAGEAYQRAKAVLHPFAGPVARGEVRRHWGKRP